MLNTTMKELKVGQYIKYKHMNNIKSVIDQIRESVEVKNKILKNKSLMKEISFAADKITDAYKNKNKTMLAGNGGSAADSQHIAGEFVSRFMFDRPGLPSIALSTDTSILTAIGNDYGYNRLFARQIEAQGVKGDIFIGISTSGNSPNIIEALKACKEKGIFSIGLTGNNKESLIVNSDLCIHVPSNSTPRIQESHILIGHILCGIVEEKIFGHLKK
jgi:D-sedoheptulose 7-phosphate isomerase